MGQPELLKPRTPGEVVEVRDSVMKLLSKMKQCGRRSKGDVNEAKLLHSHAVECGVDKNIYVATTLISMYSKCGNIRDAAHVFATMREKNIISWTALISGYVENGEFSQALNVFDSMNCQPNHVTFVAALKACAALAVDESVKKDTCLQRGVSIHRRARELGLSKHVAVATTLIELYSKCGDMLCARGVFDGMLYRDVVAWNVLLFGYVENGQSLLAWNMFQSIDCAPNSATFVAAARACAAMASSSDELEKQSGVVNASVVHRQAMGVGFDKDVDVGNSLVEMYAKFGNMQCARTVFDGMVKRNVKSWTALVSGYVDNGQYALALDAFESMNCSPNRNTLVHALKACAGLLTDRKLDKDVCLMKVVTMYDQAREAGCHKDLICASILVDVYSKCGDMLVSRRVFDGMPKRSVVSWNALIHGYVINEQYDLALEVFSMMDCAPNRSTFLAALKACAGFKTGSESHLEMVLSIHKQARELGFEEDVAVANTLLDVYCKCGDMLNAREAFGAMRNRTVVSWNIMLLGYVENGQSSLAVDLFGRMDCAPTTLTYVGMLKACASVGDLHRGNKIHLKVCQLGLLEDEAVAASLVDFYGKCGNVVLAQLVFNQIYSPDVVSWTALLGGYSATGDTVQMFSLVRQMLESGVHLDSVTLQIILTCCSHSGMVEEGEKYFENMWKYGIDPRMEHYTCMVDILGRANRLHEAFALAKKMPCADNGAVWMSLLAACRKWKNLELGINTFKEIVSLNIYRDQGVCAAAFLLMKSNLGSQVNGL